MWIFLIRLLESVQVFLFWVASRCAVTGFGLRKLHPHGGGAPRKVAGESLCRGAETIPGLVPCDDDGTVLSRRPGWRAGIGMKRASCCAVKGDVDACELRPRRGFPDKTDAATNRRWVTADTPPTLD